MFAESDVKNYLARQRDHRVQLSDDDLARFQTDHAAKLRTRGEQGNCRRRVVTAGPRTKNCNDVPVELTEDQLAAVLGLARAGGYAGPDLDGRTDLGVSDADLLARSLGVAVALVHLAREGRGVTFGVKYES
jgi:hypothetical protein